MGAKTAVSVGAAAVAAGLVTQALVRKRAESGVGGRHPDGWKAVTILGDSADFAQGGYPAPLQRVAGALEIRMEAAPGDRGFEVHARVRDGADVSVLGDKPDHALRAALRDAKQLFETGEILQPVPRPHGHRPPTLFGAAVDAAEREAKGGGVL